MECSGNHNKIITDTKKLQADLNEKVTQLRLEMARSFVWFQTFTIIAGIIVIIGYGLSFLPGLLFRLSTH